jgi:GntR family transcriptional regulator/MocR family aminotransferase
VALIGTVSKALAPALRLGWLAVPPRLAEPAVAAKVAADLGGPALEQLALAELLAGGGYDRHLRRARRAHRQRRDAVVAAVREHLPGAAISGIAAGLHLVIALPPGIDDAALAARARAVGLAPVALSTLCLRPPRGGAPDRRGVVGRPPGLVIGYAAHTPDELRAAIAQLAKLV